MDLVRITALVTCIMIGVINISAEEIQLWVDKVLAYSSQYTPTRWAAKYVVGPADVYPAYGDISNGSWSEAKPACNTAFEYIVVHFQQSLFISKVEIYEIYNAGGVKAIKAKAKDGTWQKLWSTDAVKHFTTSRIFSPPIKEPSFSTDTLRIEISCGVFRSINHWVDIDAVRVTGRKEYCHKPCKNNGTCIAMDVCECPHGFLGSTCQIGGTLDSYLAPRLEVVEPEENKAQSWYDGPSYADNEKICFLKVGIKGASEDTILFAESLNNDTYPYGNFTAGPQDTYASTKMPERVACLQFRCPTTLRTYMEETKVVIFPITESHLCSISYRNPLLLNLSSVEHVAGKTHFNVRLQAYNNYGPSYGVYVLMGQRRQATYFCRRECFGGTAYAEPDIIDPFKNVAATFQCIAK